MHKNILTVVGITILFLGVVVTPILGVSIDDDTTPPVTTISFHGQEGENGWFVRHVGMRFTAIDDQSGVNSTFYRINDGKWEIYINDVTEYVIIEDDGVHTIEYYSIDNAGNTEEVKSAELKIDQCLPFIHVDIKKLETNKWKFIATCIDTLSGMDRVEFYFEDELEFIDYEKPYEWIWNDTKLVGDSINVKGPYDHNFSFIAYDKAGNTGQPSYTTGDIVRGIIFNPQFSEYSVSFFAVLVILRGEIVKFERITYSTIGSSGYIGIFFIWAEFQYKWPVV